MEGKFGIIEVGEKNADAKTSQAGKTDPADDRGTYSEGTFFAEAGSRCRFQFCIDEYNHDNEKDEIAIIFEKLMKLVNEMDDEERRYVREGFNSDEELAIYDLLFQESLSKEDIKKVKALAQTLLSKIKAKIKELDHWTDKEETCAVIDIMIRDTLYNELPMSYDGNALNHYRQTIYEYVLSYYKDVA